MTTPFFYQRFISAYGEMGLAWVIEKQTASSVVRRIFLPAGQGTIDARVLKVFPGAVKFADSRVEQIISHIEQYLGGHTVEFSLDNLGLDACGAFQERVLRLSFQIPRSKVLTYGHLAVKLGHPRAARAVGTALARNPFPIVIPCQRVIRGDRTLGGFGGGLRTKRALLEMEGIRFDRYGRVMKDDLISPPPYCHGE